MALPTPKTTKTTKTASLPDTGLGAYLKSSKLFTTKKPVKK